MFEKLADVERKYNELEDSLASGTLSPTEYTRITKERAALTELVETYRRYEDLRKRNAEAQYMLENESDPDLKAMAKEEINETAASITVLEQELMVLTLPQDPNDSKNVILEVRAGTGGEEASLFASDLLRMYQRYADKAGWRTELMSMTDSSSGGVKEAVILISGNKVYSRLKFESGVHRVQRVPETEAQGRVHTSACTVAILPEADDVEVNIRPEDLDITTSRASGAGGQHVNKTDSAIRIVHKPTGTVVECQDERSQHKNRERAMKILASRLLERAQQEQAQAISASRKSQVGSGDRSERIRTYNFPQGRLTDHRINLTLYKLSDCMEGDIGEVLDKLGAYYQAERLKEELAK
jgi:peptide chain release factor 1